MTINNTTPNRHYPVPASGNTLPEDMAKIIAALGAVDTDMAQVLLAIATKAGLDALAAYQAVAQKNVANGYAGLDATGKLPVNLIPTTFAAGLSKQGVWNAATNSPAIPAASAANRGHFYIVQVAGTTNIDGVTDWGIGDWLISNGTTWDKIDNSERIDAWTTTTQFKVNVNGAAKTVALLEDTNTWLGDHWINKASPSLVLNSTGPTPKVIWGCKDGVGRWQILPGDGSAGDNFVINALHDDGSWNLSFIWGDRVTGQANFAGPVHAPSFHGDGSALTNLPSTGVSSVVNTLFTASGTWTKPADLVGVMVEVRGGGGGGYSNYGGGQGGYSKKWYAAADLSSTETVTVGSGSTATGGTSSFKSISCVGGTAASSSVGGVGGNATNGDVNRKGMGGSGAAGGGEGGGTSAQAAVANTGCGGYGAATTGAAGYILITECCSA